MFSDVISIEKTSENFRLIYDVKGRFAVHRITPDEAAVSCPICYLRNYVIIATEIESSLAKMSLVCLYYYHIFDALTKVRMKIYAALLMMCIYLNWLLVIRDHVSLL